jgi:hypothetical protein
MKIHFFFQGSIKGLNQYSSLYCLSTLISSVYVRGTKTVRGTIGVITAFHHLLAFYPIAFM